MKPIHVSIIYCGSNEREALSLGKIFSQAGYQVIKVNSFNAHFRESIISSPDKCIVLVSSKFLKSRRCMEMSASIIEGIKTGKIIALLKPENLLEGRADYLEYWKSSKQEILEGTNDLMRFLQQSNYFIYEQVLENNQAILQQLQEPYKEGNLSNIAVSKVKDPVKPVLATANTAESFLSVTSHAQAAKQNISSAKPVRAAASLRVNQKTIPVKEPIANIVTTTVKTVNETAKQVVVAPSLNTKHTAPTPTKSTPTIPPTPVIKKTVQQVATTAPLAAKKQAATVRSTAPPTPVIKKTVQQVVVATPVASRQPIVVPPTTPIIKKKATVIEPLKRSYVKEEKKTPVAVQEAKVTSSFSKMRTAVKEKTDNIFLSDIFKEEAQEEVQNMSIADLFEDAPPRVIQKTNPTISTSTSIHQNTTKVQKKSYEQHLTTILKEEAENDPYSVEYYERLEQELDEDITRLRTDNMIKSLEIEISRFRGMQLQYTDMIQDVIKKEQEVTQMRLDFQQEVEIREAEEAEKAAEEAKQRATRLQALNQLIKKQKEQKNRFAASKESNIESLSKIQAKQDPNTYKLYLKNQIEILKDRMREELKKELTFQRKLDVLEKEKKLQIPSENFNQSIKP